MNTTASTLQAGNEQSLSVIIPAKNEAASLASLLPALQQLYPKAEIIVVNDGSTDDTKDVALNTGVRVITHPYSMGNGAAIKAGVRHATGETLIFMDADGQHDPACISLLLCEIEKGVDMVVGARDRQSQASTARWLANKIYSLLASNITGHLVSDLTSGFRAARADKFREFLYMLPNGFSYPTTSTMAFFRAGYGVRFIPVRVNKRTPGSSSHIRPGRDGARFFLIIFRVATLYSPLKIFLPISASFFAFGCLYYAYTFTTSGRFTNAGMLLFMTSLLVFLIGLVSEQITTLIYSRR